MLTSYTNIKPDQVHIKYDLTWIIFLNSVCTQSLLWRQQHTIKSIKARSISCKNSSPSGLWLCPVTKQNWQSYSREKFENARLDYHHYPFHVVLPTPEAAYHIDAYEQQAYSSHHSETEHGMGKSFFQYNSHAWFHWYGSELPCKKSSKSFNSPT